MSEFPYSVVFWMGLVKRHGFSFGTVAEDACAAVCTRIGWRLTNLCLLTAILWLVFFLLQFGFFSDHSFLLFVWCGWCIMFIQCFPHCFY